MDQDAFRQLVGSSSGSVVGSTPRNATSDEQNGGARTRVFGKQAKRAPPASAAASTSAAFLDPKPRKLDKGRADKKESARQTPASKSSVTGEAYVDRAEARRRGKEADDEFSNVERLRQDFEQRIARASSDEEKRAIREQMAFLGGDAKHSVLVKGLDFALLEQQRAKLSGHAGSSSVAGRDEDDLESAYRQSAAAGPSKADERHDGDSSDAAPRTLEPNKSKFRPIGQVAPSAADEGPEYIWKNGKRYRKKRKAAADAEAPSSSLKATSEYNAARIVAKKSAERLSGLQKGQDYAGSSGRQKSEATPLPQERPEVTRAPEQRAEASEQETTAPDKVAHEVPKHPALREVREQEDPTDAASASATVEADNDDDIFADAGRWSGNYEDQDSDDSDEDDVASGKDVASAPNASSAATTKRDWFATKEAATTPDENDEVSGSNIADAVSQAHKAAGVDATPIAEARKEEADYVGISPSPPARLAGLSDSKVDIRAILQAEQEREQRPSRPAADGDHQKRQKRRKRGAGGNDSE